jgi:hypothetical protein
MEELVLCLSYEATKSGLSSDQEYGYAYLGVCIGMA